MIKIVSKIVLLFILSGVLIGVFFALNSKKENSPSKVVENYMIFSSNNNLGEIAKITKERDDLEDLNAPKKQTEIELDDKMTISQSLNPSNFVSDIPKTKTEVYLRFVRDTFPKMFFENKLKIKSIEEEIIKENKATVSILLEDGSHPHVFPWSFY